jgi:hypothetical protein
MPAEMCQAAEGTSWDRANLKETSESVDELQLEPALGLRELDLAGPRLV